MESLMEGEIIEIEVLSSEVAEKVLHEAKQLGAIGKKVSILQEKTEPNYQHWGQLENLLSQLLEKVLSQKLEQLASFNNRELSQSATTPNLV
ncbi:hypothetical protein BGP_0006 [Beggiatoa sp. PS]|nr:hypothetical protein BGP_0006 [Beggiatoa sp. PS]